MLENNTLSILQYNVNNSKTKVMISLFETKDIEKYDILIIQKSWKNSFQFTTNNRLSQHFEFLYMSDAITRMCLFVNKRIAKTVYIHTFHSRNLISLRMRATNDKIINIHNMYNSCKDNENVNALLSLKKTLQEKFKKKHVVVKDFNLHHSSWKKQHVRTDVDAYELIVTMKKCKLKKITSIELITWSKHKSENTIDFTYTTSLLKDSMIETNIDKKMNHHSNHRSIKTILNLRTRTIESRCTKVWKKTNVDVLREKLQVKISNSETLLSTNEVFNNQTDEIDR